MQFSEESNASPLLVAANAVIQAWQYPTMDGKAFYAALHALKAAVKDANREHLLANASAAKNGVAAIRDAIKEDRGGDPPARAQGYA